MPTAVLMQLTRQKPHKEESSRQTFYWELMETMDRMKLLLVSRCQRIWKVRNVYQMKIILN